MQSRGILLAASAALLVACSNSTNAGLHEYASAFVPPDATHRIVAPDIPWVQISFTVRRPPLEFAIDEDRLARARAEGWTLCSPTTSAWSGHYDASVMPEIYRQLKTYVLYRDGVLIVLIGMYESRSEHAAIRKREGQTEMPAQLGTVIARAASHEEALEVAGHQALSCEP